MGNYAVTSRVNWKSGELDIVVSSQSGELPSNMSVLAFDYRGQPMSAPASGTIEHGPFVEVARMLSPLVISGSEASALISAADSLSNVFERPSSYYLDTGNLKCNWEKFILDEHVFETLPSQDGYVDGQRFTITRGRSAPRGKVKDISTTRIEVENPETVDTEHPWPDATSSDAVGNGFFTGAMFRFVTDDIHPGEKFEITGYDAYSVGESNAYVYLDRAPTSALSGNIFEIQPVHIVTGYNGTGREMFFNVSHPIVSGVGNITGNGYTAIQLGGEAADFAPGDQVWHVQITGTMYPTGYEYDVQPGDTFQFYDTVLGGAIELASMVYNVISGNENKSPGRSGVAFQIAHDDALSSFPGSGAFKIKRANHVTVESKPYPGEPYTVMMMTGNTRTGNLILTDQNLDRATYTHIDSVAIPPETLDLEIQANEYDSAFGSFGTRAHFFVGPVTVGGKAIREGVLSCSGTLYDGVGASLAAWNVPITQTDGTANAGVYYNNTLGMFALNTSTASFADADMATLDVRVMLTGNVDVRKTIHIPIQPPV